MKKNMIALAVAGALVAPVAMAEVTVSGGLQAELVSIGGNAASKNGLYAADGWQKAGTTVENGGNYGFLKFAATEDLGGGMKALAVYNFNVNVGDGNGAYGQTAGTPGSRDAYVGLSTGLGTVLAGTMTAPYAANRTWDPFVATSFQARGNYGMTTIHNSYAGNALAYANSFMGGMIKLTAAMVLDEEAKSTADNTTGKHAHSIAVEVAPMAGLTVLVANANAHKFNDDPATAAVTNEKLSAVKVGAKYAAGAFSVAGQVEMLDKGATTSGQKGNVIYLTGSFNIDDANTISASVGQMDKKVVSTAAEMNANTADVATYAAVGFKHAFSKNTSVMVGYRTAQDKSAGGTKENATGVGLRVNF